MEVIVSLEGAKNAERRFGRAERKIGDMAEVWPLVAESIAKSNERSWGRGVHLADSTIEQKAAAGKTEPLVWSGRLKDSLTKLEAADGVREFGPYEMKFGTKVFYGRFQNYGTSKMPRHKVLKMTVTSRRLVKKLLAEHILGK